jgi:GR25 family glycosyltransferase involved in LPS biosynthesis
MRLILRCALLGCIYAFFSLSGTGKGKGIHAHAHASYLLKKEVDEPPTRLLSTDPDVAGFDPWPNQPGPKAAAATHSILPKHKPQPKPKAQPMRAKPNPAMLLHESSTHVHVAQSVPKKTRPVAKQAETSHPQESWSHGNETACRKRSVFAPHRIPVYFVNLNESTRRRAAYTRQLSRLGFQHVYRVEARLPNAKDVSVKVLIAPAVENEPKEQACIVSHLIAMHTAVYDRNQRDYPYALITEDDILHELDVNYTAFALSAPSDFGTLQLMSSNAQEIENSYDLYWKTLRQEAIGHKDVAGLGWTRWAADKGLWSTQGYLINKAKIRAFVDQVIRYDSISSRYLITLVNPSSKLFPCNKQMQNRGFLCEFPYRIVADYYLYLGAGPTYFSQIPIFNGAKVESTIHSRSSKTHAREFDHIGRVIQRARDEATTLPSFIRPFACNHNQSTLHAHQGHGPAHQTHRQMIRHMNATVPTKHEA